MLDLESLLAALPPPRDDEPPSLRSEIVDELLDHLHCAFRREILKDGDAAAAERRVLSRFGDPKQLARRLWWQAMWSRVMGKRILSGLQWLLTLAAVFLAGAVLWQQSELLEKLSVNQQSELQWRQNLSTTLDELRTRLPAPVDVARAADESVAHVDPFALGGLEGGAGVPDLSTFPPPPLTIKLVQDKAAGPPVTGMINEIVLTGAGKSTSGRPRIQGMGGMGMGGMGGGIQPHVVSKDGQFCFDQVPPDRYELKITLADGQHSTQQVLIRDDKPRELTVICPSPRKMQAMSIIMAPLPKDLQEQIKHVKCYIEEQSLVLGEIEWVLQSPQRNYVWLDSQTGQAVSLMPLSSEGTNVTDSQGRPVQFNFKDTAEDDRVAFLASGPVGVRLEIDLYNVAPSKRSGITAGFGGMGAGEMVTLTDPPHQPREYPLPTRSRTITPGEIRWELEVPEELLAAARKQLADFKAKPAPVDPATKSPMPADEPAAQSDIFPGMGRIVVKLTRETKDGQTPGPVYVNLLDEKGELSNKHAKSQRTDLTNRELLYAAGRQPDSKTGLCTFDVDPGRYGISILFRDGLYFTTRLKPIDAGETHTEHVICPPAATKTGVLITAPPVPEDLRRDDVDYEATLVSTPTEFEGRNWRMFTPVEQPLTFDKATGQPIRAGETDLSQDKPEDREVFLPAGKYRLHYSLALIRKENGEIKVENLARRPGDFDEDFDHVISPTEKTLDIKIDDDFWTEARKRLAELEGKPAQELSEKLETKENAAGLILAVYDEDHQRPMRGVRVTLHRVSEDHFAISESIASDATTAQGQVSFGDLAREEIKVIVTVPETNLRSSYSFDLSQPQKNGVQVYEPLGKVEPKQPQLTWVHGYALSVPSRVESAGLTFRTNLPDDLAAAKVKVCLAVASDAVTVNKQEWRYYSGLERIVVGPEGFEGMLQLPRVVRDFEKAFLSGRHRVSPAAEREIRVPALRLSANRMTLICPIKSTPAEGGDAKVEEWMVCATTPVMKRMNDDEYRVRAGGSSFRFDPVAFESNEWLISLPEEMFAEARKKLAELDGK